MAEAARRKKFRIYQDEVKLRHTSHWDADFMGRAEFEAYMSGKTEGGADRENAPASSDRQTQRDREREAAAPIRSWWDRFMQACLGR